MQTNVATMKGYQFSGDPKSGPAWRFRIKKYLSSRAIDIGHTLSYIEDHEDFIANSNGSTMKLSGPGSPLGYPCSLARILQLS